MRIIAGKFGSRSLHFPKNHLVRPASDKVRGAVFNILGNIDDFNVLDLFAGSGSMGFEALSRGANRVTFVESFGESLKSLSKNTDDLDVKSSVKIVRGVLPQCLKLIKEKYDLIFVDPPYDKNLVDKTLQGLILYNIVDPQTQVIVEHSPRELPACPGFQVEDQRQYGQTYISFLTPINGIRL